jgi:hypothetical protein
MSADQVDFEIVCTYLKGTELAINVRIKTIDGNPYSGSYAHWFPKSQLRHFVKVDPENGGDCYFCAPQWICESKGLLKDLDLVAKEQADEISDQDYVELFGNVDDIPF